MCFRVERVQGLEGAGTTLKHDDSWGKAKGHRPACCLKRLRVRFSRSWAFRFNEGVQRCAASGLQCRTLGLGWW